MKTKNLAGKKTLSFVSAETLSNMGFSLGSRNKMRNFTICIQVDGKIYHGTVDATGRVTFSTSPNPTEDKSQHQLQNHLRT